MTPGNVTPVEVRLSAGVEPVSYVSAIINYPSDKLTVEYITPTTTFPLTQGQANYSGQIALSRQNVSGVTGDVAVATIGFKPISQNTTANISFGEGSQTTLTTGTEALDISLSRARSANFNILPGTIPTTNVQGGTVSELPTAGFEIPTVGLFFAGLILIIFGSSGLLINLSKSK